MNKKEQKTFPESRVQAKKRKKKLIRNWIIGILAVVCVAIAGAGFYASHLYKTAENAANKAYDKENAVKTTYGEFNGKNSFAVLLLGTDTGALDRTEKMGNTDTIIVVVVNPKKKNYTMISIPRDTMADMVGDDSDDVQKINAAYSIGGAKMTMKTVSSLLNIPVKYYALVNMKGLMKLVSYVGGIYVTPTLTFTYSGFPFKKGVRQHLNGQAALAYSRMRYDDPEGDYGRQKRQREVITKLVKKLATTDSLQNFTKIADTLSTNVKTNLSFSALKSILANYSNCTSASDSDYLHGYSAYIDDAAYQIASTSELQRVSNKIRKLLGLKTETISNRETKLNTLNIANGFNFNSSKTQNYTIYSESTTTSEVEKKKSSSSSSSSSANKTSQSSQSDSQTAYNTSSNSSTGYSTNYYSNYTYSYSTNPFSGGY
ncbi:LCP family glycopolymer transferase [Lactobacillus sp.]|uniref:LCP family glycopolymer transferase n=1 Tax=Lactobacillus sp. TaxID=1591 RepID=UPI003EF809A1